jgi:predicted NUDIX family NTP pyrophosphohydrolase
VGTKWGKFLCGLFFAALHLMIKKKSAGILLYRVTESGKEVFLVHPGGPFWKKKDKASWTIPKGEFSDDEEALSAAIREFKEETGFNPTGPFIPLASIKQKAGKHVHAWAAEGDLVPALMRSNTVTLEWPPRSGKKLTFPEVDKGAWFNLGIARKKINSAQLSFLDELESIQSTKVLDNLPPNGSEIIINEAPKPKKNINSGHIQNDNRS